MEKRIWRLQATCMKFRQVACKRKQAESCFLSALYRLSDLCGGALYRLSDLCGRALYRLSDLCGGALYRLSDLCGGTHYRLSDLCGGALYRLSDLCGGIFMKLHMKQSQLTRGRVENVGNGGLVGWDILYITLLFVFLGFPH